MKFFSKNAPEMPWEAEAESAVEKAPFFVRAKIRAKVEEFCKSEGRNKVSLDDVNKAKASFTKDMQKQIKGYQIASCFSSSGCPNRMFDSENLLKRLEAELIKSDILSFLTKHVKTGLKFHHEFRLTFADCPNSCSQPQIADFGVIAASVPRIVYKNCTLCGECVDSCPDRAITLDHDKSFPVIDFELCRMCGICSKVCKFNEITEEKRGYRVLLGGRLGRNPRLGLELPGIFSDNETFSIFRWCIDFYLKYSTDGKRFSHIFNQDNFEELSRKIDQGFFSS